MAEPFRKDHPLRVYFEKTLRSALSGRSGHSDERLIEGYLVDLLIRFLHQDHGEGLCDASGNPVRTVAEMLLHGDIRYRANSFREERDAHRQIGDYLLFWLGMFPEHPPRLGRPRTPDAALDPVEQAQRSYRLASTYDLSPYEHEAQILRRLSEEFDRYRLSLRLLRASLPGLAPRPDHDS